MPRAEQSPTEGRFAHSRTPDTPNAAARRRAEAQKAVDKLNELSKQKYVPAISRVGIYEGLEEDKAVEWLDKADEDRSVGSSFASIKVDPIFDPLRSDPRFQNILRRVNLQP